VGCGPGAGKASSGYFEMVFGMCPDGEVFCVCMCARCVRVVCAVRGCAQALAGAGSTQKQLRGVLGCV